MGGMKTWIAILAVALSAPASLQAGSASERARMFASCAGRFLAVAEHEALFSGAATDRAMARRDAFLDLLDAILPHAQADGLDAQRVIVWRSDARAAQRALLASGEFNMRPAQAAAARERAADYVTLCDGLLFGA